MLDMNSVPPYGRAGQVSKRNKMWQISPYVVGKYATKLNSASPEIM